LGSDPRNESKPVKGGQRGGHTLKAGTQSGNQKSVNREKVTPGGRHGSPAEKQLNSVRATKESEAPKNHTGLEMSPPTITKGEAPPLYIRIQK